MGLITDILKEVPLSGVLRERLTEADKKLEAAEVKIRELETENAKLRASLQQKDAEIAQLRQPATQQVAWGSQPRIKGRMGA